jgi:hypothetical protein
MEDIKNFILNILKSKQSQQHFQVLKLLQKHPILQQESDVWEKLENLLNSSTQLIKKEILKLLEIDNENILNYLLEMYDDESIEIRFFVYDKLAELKNFNVISPASMVKLLFVGLSDNSPKVQSSAKKFLKNYLNFIGVFKNPESDQMLVDDDSNSTSKNITEAVNKLKLDKDEEGELLASEKILKSNSPMKLLNKKKLSDSPSRVFDRLDIKNFYNHSKYSFTFQLITEAIIEFTDNPHILQYIKSIVENIISVTQSQTDKKLFSSDNKQINIFADSTNSNKSQSRTDKYEIFNDIYFLHHCLKFFSAKHDESSIALRNVIFEYLPDNKTFSKIIHYFYKEDPNIMILHQLILIGLYLPYNEEIGNQEMLKVLKKFIIDLDLDQYTMDTVSFRKINFGNNMHVQPDENYIQEELTGEELIKIQTENLLLPPTRKIIFSMDDLVETALKIVHKIFNNQPSQLFNEVMAYLNEMNEPLESDSNNKDSLAPLKAKQRDLVEEIKEKITIIASLEEKKKKAKDRLEIDRKINKEKKDLEELEENLYNQTNLEKNIIVRKLKMCDFLIKYSRQPSQSKKYTIKMFSTTYLIPFLLKL